MIKVGDIIRITDYGIRIVETENKYTLRVMNVYEKKFFARNSNKRLSIHDKKDLI